VKSESPLKSRLSDFFFVQGDPAKSVDIRQNDDRNDGIKPNLKGGGTCLKQTYSSKAISNPRSLKNSRIAYGLYFYALRWGP
jgi:hypothetical protein